MDAGKIAPIRRTTIDATFNESSGSNRTFCAGLVQSSKFAVGTLSLDCQSKPLLRMSSVELTLSFNYSHKREIGNLRICDSCADSTSIPGRWKEKKTRAAPLF